ncbi:MAG: sugar phosphate isomerase/epimerase family protein [bacterium]
MRMAKEAGFEGIELNMSADGAITPESARTEIERIAQSARKAGIAISSLCGGLLWDNPLTSGDPDVRERGKKIAAKSLEIASWLGADTVLVIPGFVGIGFRPGSEVVPYDVAYERSLDAIKSLSEVAEKHKVFVGVENVWNKFLLSPLEMRDFVDKVGSPYVGVYFDVGNVLLTGYPEHWIRILGGRIKKVHLKDFKTSIGNIEGFVDLLEGDVNWPEVISALKEIGYDGYLVAEVFPYKHHTEALLWNTSKSMDHILRGAG